jgi:diketogulonate reductase-like aldo/keto reductase
MNYASLFPDRLGLGTWKMGEARSARERERAAVETALGLGYRLIDTAEMYGGGEAERIVGAALKNTAIRREELCLVSKVLPTNASRRGAVRACEASLERLGVPYLDVYLLHWPGRHPFSETLQAFADLQRRGLIRHYGVSNFDVGALEGWRRAEQELGLPAATRCNQLHYCLSARGIEYELVPWQRRHRILAMAYSPLAQGRLVRHPVLQEIGAARGATAAQIALAWSIRAHDFVTIPKSVDPARLAENWAARDLRLSSAELARLDEAFPPPHGQEPLEMV